MLEFMVMRDTSLNGGRRHANVIFPPPCAPARSHCDLAFYQLSVHNVAHYSPPVFEREPGALDEWEIFLRLAGIFGGQGASVDTRLLDDLSIATIIQREVATPGSPVEGRDTSELLPALLPCIGHERTLDFILRSGPYGDGFNGQDGLSLAVLEASPHGVDLGPLQPRIPEVLRTP